jgi:hypothetical protein
MRIQARIFFHVIIYESFVNNVTVFQMLISLKLYMQTKNLLGEYPLETSIITEK